MRRLLLRLLCPAAVLAACLSTAKAHPLVVKEPLCRARVVHSEELPYAWQGSWLARVTFAVATPDGGVYQTTVTRTLSWQRAAPRYGETYWLRCDPAAAVSY
jgi:hypothetical protein